ncbi:heptaprenylglyceryl phosphate synthase [Bacillus sp. EB01]|uniref:heptaprenylglyceryl phosphate synthase n=1 Tax=Bacillus sp. EB01 TaxID=1347086 RepID=UPI0005C4522E|nr:heptaprenylglyceryl phosphate synthase [Bacillus sp. EB01]
MYDYREWRHVFKLDPAKELSDKDLEIICESGTDAVMIGGTDGVTLEKVLDLMARVRRYTVPCVLEISNLDSVSPGFDLYFVPSVLNSRDPRWINGLHFEAVREFGHMVDWDEFAMEAYIILNEDCKAARLTKADTNLSVEDVQAYAMMAEKMFGMPIVYLEYSGAYGDPEMVSAAKTSLEKSILFYGGGIRTKEQAEEMSRHADVIVVGNIIYENLQQALETVKAVRSGK